VTPWIDGREMARQYVSGWIVGTVKLWHTNVEHSVASLEVKANVCCVKFNPDSRFHLAFGSAGQ